MNETDWLALEAIAAGAGALATFLAVLVALFREPFMQWTRRARISLEVRDDPLCKVVGAHKPPEPPNYTFRLAVKNQGKTTAKRCELKVIGIERRSEKGDFVKMNEYPLSLAWVFREGGVGLVLKPETGVLDISPGETEYVQIASIRTHEKPQSKGYSYSVELASGTGEWGLGIQSGEYRIQIGVYGANFVEKPTWFELIVDEEKGKATLQKSRQR